ncbi:response regulator, partial [Aetokthonos hydrillicola]
KVAIKVLQNLGYEADVAANGEEVLQLLEKIPYDLILMDCQMPILDGLETTREIHRRYQSSFTKRLRPVVIAMTANAMKEDKQMCLDIGMDDYLSKPVSKEILAQTLERWAKFIHKQKEEKVSEEIVYIGDIIVHEIAIDWEHLHQISGHSLEFEMELLQMFVEDSYTHLETIKEAINNNDFERFQQEAHYFKGASANIGAITINIASQKLEELARSRERRGTTNLISKIEESLNQIHALLMSKE